MEIPLLPRRLALHNFFNDTFQGARVSLPRATTCTDWVVDTVDTTPNRMPASMLMHPDQTSQKFTPTAPTTSKCDGNVCLNAYE